MANSISRHECTEMNPYAEPGLLSEASLTSCTLCPEAAEPAEDVIDRCRPPGQPAGLERCMLGGENAGLPLPWGLRLGKREVAVLSSA